MYEERVVVWLLVPLSAVDGVVAFFLFKTCKLAVGFVCIPLIDTIGPDRETETETGG